MNDNISRQAAIDALEEQLDYLHKLNKDENPTAESNWYGVNWARNTIADLPSVEPKTGRWEPPSADVPNCCSVCGEDWDKYVYGQDVWYTGEVPKFCPHCGADMRGEQDDKR